MKVLVAGAGVVGTLYGYLLWTAGHDVTLLVSLDRKLRWQGYGMKLDFADYRHLYQHVRMRYYPRVVTHISPHAGYEAILVTVRHHQLASLLPQVAQGRGNADVLVLGNNWEGHRHIENFLEPGSFLMGLPDGVEGVLDKGKLFGLVRPNLTLGDPYRGSAERLEGFKTLFRSAGLQVNRVEPIEAHLQVHMASLAAKMAAALAAPRFSAFRNNINALQNYIQAGRECMNVVAARGVDLSPHPEAQFYLGSSDLWASLRTWAHLQRPSAAEVAQQQLHLRAAEMKETIRTVVETGRKLGVPMPMMESYCQRIVFDSPAQASTSVAA